MRRVSRELRNLEVVGGKISTLYNTQWVTLASEQTQCDSCEPFLPSRGKEKSQRDDFF